MNGKFWNSAKISTIVFLLFWVTSCVAFDILPAAPELIFTTGANKGEINYSWKVPAFDGEVRYTLVIMQGWRRAVEVLANGNSEAFSLGAYRGGTFKGEAGEWYSAVVLAETDMGEVYSAVKQAKAKRTGEGEYDLRFGVIADTHVGADSDYPLHKRLEKVLDWYNTEDVETLAIVGDLTDWATQDHWDIFTDSWKNHRGGLQLIAVMGNHELFDGDENIAADRFEVATGQKTNAHYVIDGYHFIVLSAGKGDFTDTGVVGGAIATGRTEIPGSLEDGDNVPPSVINWVRERINIAKSTAPGKPIFMFLHWPVCNTHYASSTGYVSSFGNDPFSGFFRNDPEVVIFSGHIHRTNSDPRAIWQGSFTSINVPSLINFGRPVGYLGNSSDGVADGRLYKMGEKAGQGLIVSVKGSKVSIENFDFDFYEGPRSLGDVVKIPQTWEFDVSRPMDFPYTNAIRNTQKTAPMFDETKPADADLIGITIRKIESTTVEVKFPQAKIPLPNYGNEVVHSYRFDFINQQTGVIDRTAKQWSDFMLTPRLQKPTYTQLIGGLKPEMGYELRIYAYGSFQGCSSQYLTCTFTTPVGPLER